MSKLFCSFIIFSPFRISICIIIYSSPLDCAIYYHHFACGLWRFNLPKISFLNYESWKINKFQIFLIIMTNIHIYIYRKWTLSFSTCWRPIIKGINHSQSLWRVTSQAGNQHLSIFSKMSGSCIYFQWVEMKWIVWLF
jgi:hypothetical protein